MNSRVTAPGSAHSGRERAHSERTFEFLAEAPLSEVAPLFGAHKERAWAPNGIRASSGRHPPRIGPAWSSRCPAAHGKAIWINTCFDPQNGRVQYAYVLENAMTTLITLDPHAARRAHARGRVVRAHGASAARGCLGYAHGRPGCESR